MEKVALMLSRCSKSVKNEPGYIKNWSQIVPLQAITKRDNSSCVIPPQEKDRRVMFRPTTTNSLIPQ